MLNTEKEEKSVWDSLVDAFLEDLKQFPLNSSLYAFVTAYNIAMEEIEKEIEKDTNPDERINLLWNEINRLKERVGHLENKPQVYQPKVKVPTDWTPATLYKCTVCGVGSANPMGYVCPRSECPSKVTCGGVVNTGAVSGTIKGLYD